MPLNKPLIQQHLRDFNFRQLFIEELGWDNPPAATAVTVDGQRYALMAIAHKRGMVAYQCPAPEGAPIPEYALRRKIEQQVIKTAHEHLIIFTDQGKTTQVWQWVKREPGKPAACREHTYCRSQSGEALTQKLQTIAFTFDEEEILTLVDVAIRTRKGFDVEHVTKRFYDQFKKEHASFLKFVEGIDDAADCEWYASVMLNRLMFVYFVQRKGFLDGDQQYLRNRLKRCQQEKGRDKFYSFYRYFLLRLFHEGLGGKARSKELQDLLGRIPYLNGGFFEKHVIEQRWDAIHIPDRAFERIFDYFDQYQWHLDERPLRADNEINPDVLGYIFEKYINQKQMGAYYTKEDITGYMSRNTIIAFLVDAARKEHKAAFEGDNAVWKLLQADPDRYIYPAIKHGITLDIHAQPPTPLKARLPLPSEIEQGVDTTKTNLIERRKAWNKTAPSEYALPTEIWREVVARRQRYDELRAKLANGQVRDINDLITLNLDIIQFAQDVIRNCDSPELLRAFWHALEKLSVLDPTVGSGAFLFAALNILKPLYEACLERMEAFVGDLDRSGEKHHPEKFSDFRAVLDRVEAHPNSDYFILKSIILNNLFGVDIMEEATEICKLRLFLKLAAQVDPDPAKDNFGIEPLPDIDFNIRAGNTLVGYTTADEVRKCMTEFGSGQMRLGVDDELQSFTRFTDKLQIADAAFRSFRQQQTTLGGIVTTQDKTHLKDKLKSLEDELNRYLANEYGVKVGEKTAFNNWLDSHRPFHWLVEFYGILSNGGFDVVIGNPPYVELSDVVGQYSIRGLSLLPTGNLYAVCMERFTQLLHAKARIGVIVPISSVSTPRMLPLMQLLERDFAPLYLSNFAVRPGKLFVGVDMNLTIVVGQKKAFREPSRMISTGYNRWSEYAREALFQTLSYSGSSLVEHSCAIAKTGSTTAVALLKSLGKHGSLARFRSPSIEAEKIYYHSGGRYFRKCIREQLSNEYKELTLQKGCADAVIGLLCSSFYYWYWITISDCYHVTKRDIDALPVPDSLIADPNIQKLTERLLCDLWKHSEKRLRNRADGSQREEVNFHVGESKPIIDEMDKLLARHYGLTDVELDYILSFDSKFRLGSNLEGDNA